MVRKIGLTIIAFSILAGCREKLDPELAAIEPVIDTAISQFRISGLLNQWTEYEKIVQATTNRELRALYSQFRRRKLLVVEIDGDDFETEARVFNLVAEGLLPNPTSSLAWRWTIEDDCAAHIERLKWMRRQLDKWKAMVGESSERLRLGNPAKFKEWGRAYARCLGIYETSRAKIEERFDFMCGVLQSTDEERSRAKRMVEKYLGWQIRPKDVVEEHMRSGFKSEEMKAIVTSCQWM